MHETPPWDNEKAPNRSQRVKATAQRNYILAFLKRLVSIFVLQPLVQLVAAGDAGSGATNGDLRLQKRVFAQQQRGFVEIEVQHVARHGVQ